MRLAIALFVIIVLVTATFFGVFTYGKEPEPLSVSNFPEQLDVVVQLPSSDQAIQYRFVELSQDGKRYIQIQTEFRNGISVYDYFRADGTLKEEIAYYPDPSLELELSKRQVKRSSQFNSSGTAIVAYQSYLEDGTPDVFSHTRADDHVESVKYGLDGKSILVRQIRDERGRMVQREHFREDGSLEMVVRIDPRRRTSIVTFQSDGVTMKAQTVRKNMSRRGYGYYSYIEDVEHFEYHDDGVTVKFKVEYPISSSTRVRYFNEKGVLIEEREFTDYGRLEVTGFYSTGQKRYEQYWRGQDSATDRSDFSDFKMTALVEYEKDGRLTRRSTFWANGNPRSSFIPEIGSSKRGLLLEFREEDGTLEFEKKQLRRFVYEYEKSFSAQDGIKSEIPSELFTHESRGSVPDSDDMPDYERSDDI